MKCVEKEDLRIFWIYFTFVFFFAILGTIYLLEINFYLTLIWILSKIFLVIIIYYSSINWAPVDNNNNPICPFDVNSDIFNKKNRKWLFINILFVIILILSLLWAMQIKIDSNLIVNNISILIIILGIVLYSLSNNIPLLIYIFYFVSWFILAFIIITNNKT